MRQWSFQLSIAVTLGWTAPALPREEPRAAALDFSAESLSRRFIEGGKFFTALERQLGHAKAMERAFQTPPSTLGAVSRPEEYLTPAGARVDLRKLGETAAGLLDRDKLKPQVVVVPENVVRQACMLAGKEAVEKAFRGYRGSTAVVANASQGMAGSQLILTLIELSDDLATGSFLELEERVSRKKDEQLDRPGAIVQIVAAEYEKLAGSGAPGIHVNKRLKIRGQDGELPVRTVVMSHQRFVIEVMAVYLPETRDDLLRLGQKLKELIDREPLAGTPASSTKARPESRVEGKEPPAAK